MDTDTPEVVAESVVKIENVCLRYYVPRERIGTFKEYAIRKVQGKIVNEEFWALKDVSFSVNRGEIFGLIGQNGAGKSTLLKLVARVLRPTSGRVWINGKVAPLLSVGAGFHRELTGRENIFLNGTLLGFTQKQMEEKFDSIVEFSELTDFIDAPIRTYSSGMVARLGFAVASDSKPEILIVDEVLSVGDEAFQRKCFERLESYQKQGTTTLLVTHNSERIRKYCHRAAWLHKGELQAIGSTDEVVNKYIETLDPKEKRRQELFRRRRPK
jgi:ABC-2 type transport system ATP-binding protein/lipopolysaccharide transport system ATP-binding protein